MTMRRWACLAALAATACAGEVYRNEGAGPKDHGHGGAAHHPPVPAPYTDMTNPMIGDAEATHSGKQLYLELCVGCHGPAGRGDGPSGAHLTPKAADFVEHRGGTDAYLYWRIAEGGRVEPFDSAMPAWKDQLSADQIWQLVNYVRVLGDGGDGHGESSDGGTHGHADGGVDDGHDEG